MADWINSLGGTPALAPPILTPASGLFTNYVTLTLQSPDTNAALYYTLDGTLPTTNSTLYTGPFELTASAVVTANAFETNYVNSVAVVGDVHHCAAQLDPRITTPAIASSPCGR
jgi:hypothetical protein